ncbi:hypothetical protein OSTOST_02303 [Ostertagia ostertagi]
MTALQADGKQRLYNVKNLYGWSEARITQKAHYAAMGKRGIVVSRNHNTKGEAPQDPALWPSVTEATKKATLFRYRYLPYLFRHCVLIFYPIQNANSVDVYLPKDDWYSLFDFQYGEACESGTRNYPAPLTSLIPVFVRGGSILPRQAANTTTSASRENAFELLIAPFTSGKKKGKAEGALYWDDGESVVESFSTHNYYHWTFKYHMNDKGAQLAIKTKRQAVSWAIIVLFPPCIVGTDIVVVKQIRRDRSASKKSSIFSLSEKSGRSHARYNRDLPLRTLSRLYQLRA